MIVDQRTYTIQIGMLKDFLALYAAEGLAVQTEHLGPPLGYFTTEVGDVNQVVHLWQYIDMADRERRRARLDADPRWQAYRRKASAAGQLLRQTNALLKAVDFSAISAAHKAP